MATQNDIPVLSTLARRAFITTYAEFNTPENMKQHLDDYLSEKGFQSDLSKARMHIYLAEDEDYEPNKVVGYFQLARGDWYDPDRGSVVVEVLRFYLEPDAKGRGFGKRLMQRCKIAATNNGYKTIWLGVWEENIRAINFYERMGFAKVGEQTFRLGTEEQTDWVMECEL